MTVIKTIKKLLIFLGLFYATCGRAQCTDYNIFVTDNSVTGYTVTAAQKLCIAGGLVYTGNLTLDGGTICNSGTIQHILFKSGTFNNDIIGDISAATKSDMAFHLNGKTILNNYSGSQIILSDSLNVSAHSTDSLIINVHLGSSFNCGDLKVISGCTRVNIGLAATSVSTSAFITSFNVNGNALFNYHTNILINEQSSFNTSGDLTFNGEGIKILNNYGVVNLADSLRLVGDAANNGTITINNYYEFSVFGSVNSVIVNAVVNINNYPGLIPAVLYVQESINLNEINTHLYNNDVLQVGNEIYAATGTFTNSNYVEAASLTIYQGVATNNSLIFLSANLTISDADGTLNNNGVIMVANTFQNSGIVNLGLNSIISTNDFQNNGSSGIINGPTTADDEDYPVIFVAGHSTNSGYLNGRLLFLDLTYDGHDDVRIDEEVDDGLTHIGGNVVFTRECDFNLNVGFIYTRYSYPPRTTFCPGENILLYLNPYVPILSGPVWSFGSITAGGFSSSTSTPAVIFDVFSGGIVTASGTYWNGRQECIFNVNFSVSVGSASITTTSPKYFGVGNTVLLTSTVLVGAAPIQYTWSPNYFFVSPSTNHDANPIIAPQVSLIYTVNVIDAYGCTASNTLEVIGEPFALLDKKLNNEYYKLFNDQLFFKHDGQYDISGLQYYVYDKSNAVVASPSSNNLINLSSINPDDNRLTLNASTLNAGNYVLEIINEKKEKLYLRFKK